MNTLKITALLVAVTLLCPALIACEKKNSGPDLNSLTKDIVKVTEETQAPRYATVTSAEKDDKDDKSAVGEEVAAPAENQTASPAITGTVNTAPDQICIAGTCEAGSTIYIKGGVEDVSYSSDGRYFIGTAYIPASGSTDLKVSAKVGEKTESNAVTVSAKYIASARHIRTDAFEVIVGSDYQGHFVSALPDYEGTNLLESSQIKALTKNIKSDVDWLNSNMPGTEIIYLIVPNPMTVYPETVPDIYVRDTSGETRTLQFCDAATEAGAHVINLTDTFIEHKNDRYKLFCKTDSHWTEYGAWVGYTELMNYIAKKFPAAAPRTEEEMGFYKKDFGGGDMPYYLGLDSYLVREVAVFTKFTFTSPANKNYYSESYGYDTLMMNHDTTPKAATYNTGNAELPNAYVMRDSFGIQLYNELAERFNKTVYKDMWSYSINRTEVQKEKVDYVIYVLAERNLGELIY